MKKRNTFSTIRTEGGLLPARLLERIATGDGGIKGLTPEDYHIVGNVQITRVGPDECDAKVLSLSDPERPVDKGCVVIRE